MNSINSINRRLERLKKRQRLPEPIHKEIIKKDKVINQSILVAQRIVPGIYKYNGFDIHQKSGYWYVYKQGMYCGMHPTLKRALADIFNGKADLIF